MFMSVKADLVRRRSGHRVAVLRAHLDERIGLMLICSVGEAEVNALPVGNAAGGGLNSGEPNAGPPPNAGWSKPGAAPPGSPKDGMPAVGPPIIPIGATTSGDGHLLWGMRRGSC
jgi:hypothetical protein